MALERRRRYRSGGRSRGIGILAPVEVVSFNKTRARRTIKTTTGHVTRWGIPSRFDFTPETQEVPLTVQGVYWNSAEQVFTGDEVFRDASVTPVDEEGLPVETEGIRVTTFDLGERVIRTEETHRVDDVTIIHPKIEYRHEYLELEFALTTVLSRGSPPPPDTPPSPKPEEIADSVPVEQTYDWGAPAFSGVAAIPIPLSLPDVVELGAFRTPVRFAVGGTYMVLGYAVAGGATRGSVSEFVSNQTFITVDLIPGKKIGYASPTGDVDRYNPLTASELAEVATSYLAFHVQDIGSGANVTSGAAMIVWGLNVVRLRAIAAETGATVAKVEVWGRGQYTIGGDNPSVQTVSAAKVFYRANPSASGNETITGNIEGLINSAQIPPYWPPEWPSVMNSGSVAEAFAGYAVAADPVEWDDLAGIISTDFTPPVPTASAPQLVQTLFIDLTTLQIVPPPGP